MAYRGQDFAMNAGAASARIIGRTGGRTAPNRRRTLSVDAIAPADALLGTAAEWTAALSRPGSAIEGMTMRGLGLDFPVWMGHGTFDIGCATMVLRAISARQSAACRSSDPAGRQCTRQLRDRVIDQL
jgi:hypothetical protein